MFKKDYQSILKSLELNQGQKIKAIDFKQFFNKSLENHLKDIRTSTNFRLCDIQSHLNVCYKEGQYIPRTLRDEIKELKRDLKEIDNDLTNIDFYINHTIKLYEYKKGV